MRVRAGAKPLKIFQHVSLGGPRAGAVLLGLGLPGSTNGQDGTKPVEGTQALCVVTRPLTCFLLTENFCVC